MEHNMFQEEIRKKKSTRGSQNFFYEHFLIVFHLLSCLITMLIKFLSITIFFLAFHIFFSLRRIVYVHSIYFFCYILKFSLFNKSLLWNKSLHFKKCELNKSLVYFIFFLFKPIWKSKKNCCWVPKMWHHSKKFQLPAARIDLTFSECTTAAKENRST